VPLPQEGLGLDAVITTRKKAAGGAQVRCAARDCVYFDNVGGEHLNAALPRMNAWPHRGMRDDLRVQQFWRVSDR